MNETLSLYKIELAVVGIHPDSDPDAPATFSHELSMRPHIREPQVTWQDDGRQALAVSLVVAGLGSERTGQGMAEELHEVSAALLQNPAGVHVTVLNVTELHPF